jgi:hypothetical protein
MKRKSSGRKEEKRKVLFKRLPIKGNLLMLISPRGDQKQSDDEENQRSQIEKTLAREKI